MIHVHSIPNPMSSQGSHSPSSASLDFATDEELEELEGPAQISKEELDVEEELIRTLIANLEEKKRRAAALEEKNKLAAALEKKNKLAAALEKQTKLTAA